MRVACQKPAQHRSYLFTMEREIHPGILALAGPPPPGINLEHKQTTAIIVVALLSTAFATVALLLRIWARNFQRFGMMADDYLMIVALVGKLEFYVLKSYCRLLTFTRSSPMVLLLSRYWGPTPVRALTSGL